MKLCRNDEAGKLRFVNFERAASKPQNVRSNELNKSTKRQQIQCECGAFLQPSSLRAHLLTSKHLKKLLQKEEEETN